MNSTTKSKVTNLGNKQVGRKKGWWGGGGIRDRGIVARMCFIDAWTCQ